jgi:hypothetical protein
MMQISLTTPQSLQGIMDKQNLKQKLQKSQWTSGLMAATALSSTISTSPMLKQALSFHSSLTLNNLNTCVQILIGNKVASEIVVVSQSDCTREARNFCTRAVAQVGQLPLVGLGHFHVVFWLRIVHLVANLFLQLGTVFSFVVILNCLYFK